MAQAVVAFVLVEAEPSRVRDLTQELRELALVDATITGVHACLGPFDLIVRIESPDLESLAGAVAEGLASAVGVRRVVTCLELFSSSAAGAAAHSPGRVVDAVLDAGFEGCTTLTGTLKQKLSSMPPGAVLEVRSRELTTREDVPAWCRLTGHELLEQRLDADELQFFIKRRL